ncbi:DUF927 domain-containing protein [Mammaliicoccus vitulinus]|uniref:phage NrS-1 polymerase family protein n=1 Tax=Mammaliicoccus vitulinus TaxID=71237 RepID=UPI001F547DC0|nr:DUF927 domain-containing protein [Mammaliicoccus vitulinus]
MAITTKEKIVKVNRENVPAEMAQRSQWVLWKAEKLKDKEEYSKVPYQLLGNLKASATNPSTWSNFDKTIQKLDDYEGVGFVLTKEDDYICLDLDDIHIDKETYKPMTDIAKEVMQKTWWEVSPSGTGIHAYFKGTLPDEVMKKNKSEHLELYSHSRFMTFTGVNDDDYREVSSDQSYIDSLVERYFKREVITNEFIPNEVTPSNLDDVEVMQLIAKSKNADKLSKLMSGGWREIFESQSEADLSLLNALAFYTQKNIAQMDKIFRGSDLMRPKWDELRGSKTYGQISIERAINDCKNVYDPKFKKGDFTIVLNETVIPKPYSIGKNGWLYKITEKGKGDDKQTISNIMTSTPPIITTEYRDIESSNVTYEMSFQKNNRTNKIPVQALDIADAKNIINLSSNGLDVDTINRMDLVNFISKYKRLNKIKIKKTVSRLGHVKGHFIHPLINSDVELVIHEDGYKRLASAFKTKGTLKGYSDTVFKQVKNSPMAMMVVYASLGSILLNDFDVEPFIEDISGKTSTGKTTVLKVGSSVWGTNDLISEWNTTKVNVERKASMMNSFPLIYDDTRKAPVYQLADIVYQFSGGRSKGRGNIHSIDVEKTWKNILISTGETSIVEYDNGKGGMGARVITLQDNPFNDDVDLRALYDGLENNYGHLGLAFIEQYEKHKTEYKESFKGHAKLFVEKAGDNEVMQRLGRPFALLQTSAEILNDIEGFEHDPYSTVQFAYESMTKNNQSIDKPKQLLEEIIDKLNANRGRIAFKKHLFHDNSELMAVYKDDFILVMSPILKEILGTEFNSIIKQWYERGYLETNKEGKQKNITFYGEPFRGYAIKSEIINELGYSFKKKS